MTSAASHSLTLRICFNVTSALSRMPSSNEPLSLGHLSLPSAHTQILKYSHKHTLCRLFFLFFLRPSYSFPYSGEALRIPLKKEEAEFARDTLAKYVYGSLFDYIVTSINMGMPLQAESKTFIGIHTVIVPHPISFLTLSYPPFCQFFLIFPHSFRYFGHQRV